MNVLHGKVVLLHDAANGLAQNIAIGLLEAGASVILSSRSYMKHEIIKDKAKARNLGERLHVLSFSIRSSEDMLLAKKAILRGWGGLDSVIALPERMENRSALEFCDEPEWDKNFNQSIKRYFSLARTFIPVLALRRPSLYITVSARSVLHTAVCSGMESISHTVQFMMAQALCLEGRDNPSLHNLVVSAHDSVGETWITPSNVGEAVVKLIENADWNRGYFEFENNWRDRMEEPQQDLYVGGI